jgi:hypothetical protein
VTSGGSGGGSTSGCASGTVSCGSSYCSPTGNQCCASVGRPDISCRTGSYCTASGCVTSSGSAGGGGTTGSGSGSVGGGGSIGGSGTTTTGGYTCSAQIQQGCSMRYCLSNDVRSCYYEVNGNKVSCGDCTSTSSLTSCAERAVDICIGSGSGSGGGSSSGGSDSDSDDSGGCSLGSRGRGLELSWVLMLGAFALRRRRSTLS